MLKRPLLWVLIVLIFLENIALSMGFASYYHTNLDDAFNSGAREVTLNCEITDVYEKGESKCVYIGKCEETAHELISYDKNLCRYLPGTKLILTGKISELAHPDNPGEFDKFLYYRGIGIDYQLSDVKIISAKENEQTGLSKVKQYLGGLIDDISTSEEENGLFKAMVLGDKSKLSDEADDLFGICGISHILAISGMHLSILSRITLGALLKTRLPRLISLILATLILLLYVLMINGHASTWRALIMFVISLVAGFFGRSYDPINALSLSGILLLIEQPIYAAQSAFLMSYTAVLGISIFSNNIWKYMDYFRNCRWARKVREGKLKNSLRNKINYSRLIDRCRDVLFLPAISSFTTMAQASKAPVRTKIHSILASGLAMSLSIQMISIPINAWFYYTISPYSIFVNILIVPFVSLALVSILLGMAGAILAPGIGVFFVGVAHYFFRILISICEFVAELPFAEVVVGRPSVLQMVLYYALITTIYIVLKCGIKYEKKKKTICGKNILAAVLLFIAAFALLFIHPLRNRITALYVGQGQCVCVEHGGHNFLIDCGSSSKNGVGEKVILPFLKSSGIDNIDAIFLSHEDSDHVNGLEDILSDKAIKVKKIVIGGTGEAWEEVIETAKRFNKQVIIASAGDKIVAGRNSSVVFEVISPIRSYKDGNDESMVLTLKMGDFCALFPGDISTEAEKDIVKKKCDKADLLMCPHHGSKYSCSAEFLKAFAPDNCIISSGRGNRYGHPAAETLSRLEASGIRVFNTKESGAIISTINTDGSMAVDVFKK